MNAVLLYCPHLGRNIAPIRAAVPDLQVLEGQPVTPGEAGCLQMHQDAVRLAQAQGWSAVTVIEDDCQFTPAFNWSTWQEACRWAEAQGYGAVVGGTVKAIAPRVARRAMFGWALDLITVDACCSAHFVTHFARGYRAVLDAAQPFDLSFSAATPTLVAHPFVAVQAPGRSGIGRPIDPGASQRYAGPGPVDYRRHFAATERRLWRLTSAVILTEAV